MNTLTPNTLTSAPVAPLIDSLFAQAEAATDWGVLSHLPEEELSRMMASTTDYLPFYTWLKDLPLAVSRETGTLLYMLARSCRAQAIVEFGTSWGLSTLHLAAALRDNLADMGGGGRLIGSEFEPTKLARAQAHLAAGGLADLVDLREGDALLTLARDLPERIDLVLLDGHKALYPAILDLLEPHLRPGALIVADNADRAPDYLARVRGAGAGYLSLPFGPDVEVSMRL